MINILKVHSLYLKVVSEDNGFSKLKVVEFFYWYLLVKVSAF